MEEFWHVFSTFFYVFGSICGIISFIDMLIEGNRKMKKQKSKN